jgi:hypothetical protein
MPTPAEIARALDDAVRDLDLVVYRLERAEDPEVRRLRRELERIRERLESLVRTL